MEIKKLLARGACNNAYTVETERGEKFIIKEARKDPEFKAQNSLLVEAAVIQKLSALNLSVPVPQIRSISEDPESFEYGYIEGDLLIDVWKNLSGKERIRICQELGRFHAEIGQKVSEEMAREMGVQISHSLGLHPEVEKEIAEILAAAEVPPDYKDLAQKAKTLFDQTLDSGVFQFLHNDAHHENILIKDKKIAGIIDFGESEYGEIAKEFSRYIRDFPDHAEFIISAYEKASGHKLSRQRLITYSFLSGLMDNVKANKSVAPYEEMILKLKN